MKSMRLKSIRMKKMWIKSIQNEKSIQMRGIRLKKNIRLRESTTIIITLFCVDNDNTFRSSRPEVFCKKSVLRNFAKFTGGLQLY